ncbi:hypothetical protein [Limnoglobus roseus]|uniref:Glycosyltransferase RgtA/B/C/D-like domain-containing protein n=1 Tax=Limnoglobus roseus TaxID=2598579 RepID=A0A5C1APM7_9BACT|nr:hypothetical protein [Limnoglobus roseus]QEL21121.1 hypothetical protein PX52LOC_08251 [Limnoglobus roseus]
MPVPGIATLLRQRLRLARPATPAGVLGAIAVLVVFVVGFAQGPMKFVGSDFGYLPGDIVDNRFNHYVLEHGYHTIAVGKVKRFWNAPFMFPTPMMTAGSDHHLATLPLYAVLRAVGFSPEHAFQGWFLVLSALNFAAAYWAARRFSLDRIGAAAAAYLFAFGLPAFGQVTHIQLVERFAAPVAVALAWRFLWQPSPRTLFAASAAFVAQVYACMYIGLLTAVLIAGLTVVVALLARRELPWRTLLWPGWAEIGRRLLALAVPTALLIVLLIPYAKMTRATVGMEAKDILDFVPDPAAWVRPPIESTTWGWMRDRLPDEAAVKFVSEKALFPGGLAFLGLGFGLFALAKIGPRAGDSPTLLAAACAIVVLPVPLIFWQFGDWSLYRELLALPGVGKLRASGRVIFVLMIPLGLLVGLLFDGVLNWVGRRNRVAGGVTAVGLLALLVLDQATLPADARKWNDFRYPVAASVTRRTAFADAVRAWPGAKLLYAFPGPKAEPIFTLLLQVDTMWAALDVGIPTVNGYTGYPPPNWFPFENYCDLLYWVRTHGALTPEVLEGLATFGTPTGHEGEPWEMACRERFKPRPIPYLWLPPE